MLKIGIAPEMNRVPKCPIDDCILKWMRAVMMSLLEECSSSQAKILADVVEVIDVSNGMQKAGSLPMVQCRAKMAIPSGTLRLFPTPAKLCLQML